MQQDTLTASGGVNNGFIDSASMQNANVACRGFFWSRKKMQFRDCLDGLANTIAMGELATDLGDNDIRTTLDTATILWTDGVAISCRVIMWMLASVLGRRRAYLEYCGRYERLSLGTRTSIFYKRFLRSCHLIKNHAVLKTITRNVGQQLVVAIKVVHTF